MTMPPPPGAGPVAWPPFLTLLSLPLHTPFLFSPPRRANPYFSLLIAPLHTTTPPTPYLSLPVSLPPPPLPSPLSIIETDHHHHHPKKRPARPPTRQRGRLHVRVCARARMLLRALPLHMRCCRAAHAPLSPLLTAHCRAIGPPGACLPSVCCRCPLSGFCPPGWARARVCVLSDQATAAATSTNHPLSLDPCPSLPFAPWHTSPFWLPPLSLFCCCGGSKAAAQTKRPPRPLHARRARTVAARPPPLLFDDTTVAPSHHWSEPLPVYPLHHHHNPFPLPPARTAAAVRGTSCPPRLSSAGAPLIVLHFPYLITNTRRVTHLKNALLAPSHCCCKETIPPLAPAAGVWSGEIGRVRRVPRGGAERRAARGARLGTPRRSVQRDRSAQLKTRTYAESQFRCLNTLSRNSTLTQVTLNRGRQDHLIPRWQFRACMAVA